MKKKIIYAAIAITALFLLAVAHYSLKEINYNLGSAKPIQVDTAISQRPDSFVSVKGEVQEKDVVHLAHNGIDMYFYPLRGYNERMFLVTDGKPLPKDMLSGTALITGQLKELSRVPFARNAYEDLGVKPGIEYFAVKVGKEPNPGMVFTYAILLLIGGLFFLPVVMEVRYLRRETRDKDSAFA